MKETKLNQLIKEYKFILKSYGELTNDRTSAAVKFQTITDFLFVNKNEIFDLKKLSIETIDLVKERGFTLQYKSPEIKRNPKSDIVEFVRNVSLVNFEKKIIKKYIFHEEENEKMRTLLLLIENELTESLLLSRSEMVKYSTENIRLIKIKRTLIQNSHKRLGLEKNSLSIFLNSPDENPDRIDTVYTYIENILGSTEIKAYYFLKSLIADNKTLLRMKFI
nr:hypothetical protein [uncultured Flavobacterium sp.]